MEEMDAREEEQEKALLEWSEAEEWTARERGRSEGRHYGEMVHTMQLAVIETTYLYVESHRILFVRTRGEDGRQASPLDATEPLHAGRSFFGS